MWPVVAGQKGLGFYIIDAFVITSISTGPKWRASTLLNTGFVVHNFDKTARTVQPLGWTMPGPREQVFDQIAKIADNGANPLWSENFRLVFRVTYQYKMPRTLSWDTPAPVNDGEEKLWFLRYDASTEIWDIGE